jgi:hypothetical protein
MKKAAVPSILVVVGLLVVAVIAEAQQPTKVPRIGFVIASSRGINTAREQAFLQGLRDLGYLEWKKEKHRH